MRTLTTKATLATERELRKRRTPGLLPAPPCLQIKTFRIAAIANRHAARLILTLMVTVVRFHMGVTPFLDHAGAAHEGCG